MISKKLLTNLIKVENLNSYIASFIKSLEGGKISKEFEFRAQINGRDPRDFET